MRPPVSGRWRCWSRRKGRDEGAHRWNVEVATRLRARLLSPNSPAPHPKKRVSSHQFPPRPSAVVPNPVPTAPLAPKADGSALLRGGCWIVKNQTRNNCRSDYANPPMVHSRRPPQILPFISHEPTRNRGDRAAGQKLNSGRAQLAKGCEATTSATPPPLFGRRRGGLTDTIGLTAVAARSSTPPPALNHSTSASSQAVT